MERKNTDQLQQELMTGNDLDRVLADNDSSFQGYALQERLQALFQRREISKTALAPPVGHQRGVSPPGIFRTAHTLPQPVAVPVLRPWRFGG